MASAPPPPPPPLSTLPTITLSILSQSIPARIDKGIQEIQRNHIRSGAILVNRSNLPVPSGPHFSPSPSSSHGPPNWKWNLVFSPDPSMHPRSVKVSTSSTNFAPHTPRNPTDSNHNLFCPPFFVTVSYPPSHPHLAFRGLGHVLGITRSLVTPLRESGSRDLKVKSGHPHLPLPPTDEGSLHPHLFSTCTPPSATPPHQRKWYLSPHRAEKLLNVTQTSNFATIGTMIDCSRNGVLNLGSAKYLLRSLSLMGYNMLQLYTEDTYRIQGEPFFGYMRGGYTSQELSQLDDYAFHLGIELIPCIQTLGHLGQILQWPRFLGMRDTAEVLLAEWEETYSLLERMIRSASHPLRSKRIHLGMDETHGLGQGRYHSIFGRLNAKEATTIFVEHLGRVNEICRKLGLEPMIWSDMLFCLPSMNNSLAGYYGPRPKTQAWESGRGGIPEGIDLVYWDYYHTSVESYSARIRSHVELGGKPPWMASGSWTWSRFWTSLPFTFLTCRANLNASKSSSFSSSSSSTSRPGELEGGHGGDGVKHVFLTIWGDEGNEVDLWSSLPAWLYYAEHCYTESTEVDVTSLKAKFDSVVGADFDDFVMASRLDDPSPEMHQDQPSAASASEEKEEGIRFSANTSKWLLWSDPMFSFVEPSLNLRGGLDWEAHYAWLEEYFDQRLGGGSVQRSGFEEGEEEGHDFNRYGSNLGEGVAGDGEDPERVFHSPSPREATAEYPSPSTTIRDHPFNARLKLPLLLAKTLRLKVGLRQKLHEAYVHRDWNRLANLTERMEECKRSVEQLWNYHRQMWENLYKPNGWETLELRYGGLIKRMETVVDRLKSFLRHIEKGGQVGQPLTNPTFPIQDPNPRQQRLPAEEDEILRDLQVFQLGDQTVEEEGDPDPNRDFSVLLCKREENPTRTDWKLEVDRIQELEEPLLIVYGSPDQLLDYHRVSRPTYC
ncbi:glycoside hydrolase [Violaceomyces palustris]|uniref:Glycoside hydrolase n=1 Tax=Violaceomyces palustris TaxID=1673888 RepID=A0ACD0P2V3_9BASI|nr:glycoside hydrolase [Violaceomyces palustris]